MIDQNGRHKKSRILLPSIDEFRVIVRRYSNSIFKRKIAESFFIKELRQSLDIHEKFVPLKLFD